MEWKLAGVKAVLVGLVVVIIILAVTCVLPPMMEDISIEPPREDNIEWSVEDDEIVLKGDILVNNSGYYPLEDLKINMMVQGLNKTLFVDNTTVESVQSNERKRIPIELRRNKSFFTEADINTLIYNKTAFVIDADMETHYPFKLMTFDLQYNDETQWDGIVEELEINEDETKLTGGNQEGSIVQLPVRGTTTDQLSDTANIELTLLGNKVGETEKKEYSTDDLDITLGGSFDKNIEFSLDGNETEEFIFNDQDLMVSARLSFRDFDISAYHNVTYQWDSYVEYLDFKYAEAEVQRTSQGSDLILPFRAHTSDSLSGDASVDVQMYREATPNTEPYSSDEVDVPLGTNTTEDIIFALTEQQSKELITNSQGIEFVADIQLKSKNVEFEYRPDTYEWGAPLDQLEIEGVYHDPDTDQVKGNISFVNDSPRTLQLIINVTVYNSNGQIVGYEEKSYQTNDGFLVSEGESFFENLAVPVSGDATSGEIKFIDDKTGMEYEKEVQV